MKPGLDFLYDPSLRLYVPLWDIDGDSIMEKSPYGHLGTVTGAVLHPGRGRFFDGSDDIINFGNPTALQVSTSSITVGFWVNKLNTSANKEPIMKYDGSGVGWYVRLDFSATNKLHWRPADPQTVDSGVTLLNTWHNLVFAQSGTICKVYVDGKYVGEFTGCYQNTSVTSDLKIGGVTSTYINALIGEVWIYNRALNALEIQHIYEATKGRYK